MSFFTIGPYEIGNICYLSYPCQHNVRKTGEIEWKLTSAIDIYFMLREQGLMTGHFVQYAEHICKHNLKPKPDEELQFEKEFEKECKLLEDEYMQKRDAISKQIRQLRREQNQLSLELDTKRELVHNKLKSNIQT